PGLARAWDILGWKEKERRTRRRGISRRAATGFCLALIKGYCTPQGKASGARRALHVPQCRIAA
ncbi:MAG: hypothetical protein O7B79_06125, partial [SAR324 cluster bacterium]|nr:hypothetical protein [SAR324 cluster bacterium]